MIGKTLAHYEILEKIGAGGMGEVYRARDRHLGRDVAMKILPVVWSSDAARVRRFEREAKTLASLQHPNIAAVYGFHEDHGVHALTMELVDGVTLASCISTGGLQLERLLDVAIPFADAIAFAHSMGVVHRDLKPDNVMLDASGRLRVLDFGVASIRSAMVDAETDTTIDTLTVAGEVVGTAAYMAPEQLEGKGADSRSDVFAAGIVLYELATGRHPFRAGTVSHTQSAILRDDPAPLHALRPDLPADFARVLRRCLAKDPERRLQTALDLRNELEDIRAGVRTEEAVTSVPACGRSQGLVEHRMRLTAEHVRSLSTYVPRMLGDSMTYLDNELESDVLTVYVPGIGFDQREFESALQETTFRATAVSLYGLGPNARIRPSLSFADHNRLLAFLVEEIRRRVAPKTFVLAGMSSGADQALHILSSTDAERIRPDGLVLLGPTVRSSGGKVSRVYSTLSEDPVDILKAVRTVAETADDLDSWLYVHEYLVWTFSKIGTDVAALREFARGYVESFGEDAFLRAALDQVPAVRCVFAEDEREDVDFVLERHIRDNVLGPRFSEEVIVADATRRHTQLKAVPVVLPLIEEVAGRVPS